LYNVFVQGHGAKGLRRRKRGRGLETHQPVRLATPLARRHMEAVSSVLREGEKEGVRWGT
jgi:hypothetical protein